MASHRDEPPIIDSMLLVIVDMQDRLMAVMPESTQLTDRTRRLIEGARRLGLPVIFTEQAPAKLGPTVPPLRALMQEPALEKITFSCWDAVQFRERVHAFACRHLVVAGIETHVCVWQTVRDLLREKYRVDVVADAVASRDPATRDLSLARMRDAGASITCVEMLLFELLRSAEHEAFRAISQLVK